MSKCSCSKNIVVLLEYGICFFSMAAILIIQLTGWRPFGFAEKAEEINTIILNPSYSYLAAVFFYLVMNYIPKLQRKKIMRRRIDSYLSRMKSAIQRCIKDINLYSFEPNKPFLPKFEFIKQFSEMDLTPSSEYLNILKKEAHEINLLVDSLLTIQDFLFDEEINKLLMIKDSLFLTHPIRPKGLHRKREWRKNRNTKQTASTGLVLKDLQVINFMTYRCLNLPSVGGIARRGRFVICR